MESNSKSSKGYRARDLFPSVKPSYLSLNLVFVCIILLLRNESTNDRLLALEKQIKVLSTKQSFAETGSYANRNEMSVKPQLDSDQIFARRIKTPVAKKLDYPSGREIWKKFGLTFILIIIRRSRSIYLNWMCSLMTLYPFLKFFYLKISWLCQLEEKVSIQRRSKLEVYFRNFIFSIWLMQTYTQP